MSQCDLLIQFTRVLNAVYVRNLMLLSCMRILLMIIDDIYTNMYG